MARKKLERKKLLPSTNGLNGCSCGRDCHGRFTEQNHFGRGNPYAAKVAKLRSALLEAVSPDDITAVIKKLIAKSKQGDVVCAKEIFDRTLGKPVEYDFVEKLEELEQFLAERIDL